MVYLPGATATLKLPDISVIPPSTSVALLGFVMVIVAYSKGMPASLSTTVPVISNFDALDCANANAVKRNSMQKVSLFFIVNFGFAT